MITNLLTFIASLPDNIRAGLAVLMYITAFLMLTFLSSTGGSRHD
jgi:hypothetical protein